MATEVSYQAGGSERTLVSEDALARNGNWAPIQDSRGGVGAGDSAAAPVVLIGESGHLLAWVAACSAQETGPACCKGSGHAGSSRGV